MGQFFSKSSKKKDQDLSYDFDEFLKTVKDESRILSQKYIILIRSYLGRQDIRRAVSTIRAALKEIESAPVHVAVTGETGSGKSSFINALRRVGHEGDDAAPTGVEETTKERVPYKHPRSPRVTLWDLPGIGTSTFPAHKYPEEMKFGEYDCFIITSCTRFKENDAQLAKLIHKMKKNFYFVRTKVDNDLHNQKKYKPLTFDQESLLETIRKDCLTHLREAEVSDPRVFLVSSHDTSEYDFPILENTLLKDLPAEKRHNFMVSLPSVTEAVIESKRNVLMQKISLEAVSDYLSHSIAFPGSIDENDEEMLVHTLNRFRTFFGLDDASLRRMAEILNMSLEEIKLSIHSANFLTCQENHRKLANILTHHFSASGNIFFPAICITKRVAFQLHILNLVVEDAKAIIKNEKLFRAYVHSL